MPGWLAWRFTALSWPDTTAAIDFTDEGSGLFWGWIAAALVVLGLSWWSRLRARGVNLQRRSPFRYSRAFFHVCFPEQFVSVTTAGLFAGGLTVAYYSRLGSGIAWPRSVKSVAAKRSAFKAAAAPGGRLVRSGLRASFPILVAVVRPSAPCPAPAPSDQQPAHSRPSALRLASMSRGRIPSTCSCARAITRGSRNSRNRSVSSPPEKLLLTAVDSPDLLAGAANQAVLQSDLDALCRTGNDSERVWRVPIKGIHEISATLNGRPVPVMIEEEGQQAAIPIPGPGRFRIHFRGAKFSIKDGTS